MLKRQGESGWWAMFPSLPDEANASTSATAWTVLALHHQLEKNLIAAEQHDAAKAAIERSVRWLTRRAVVGAARWTEYPPDQTFERTIDYLAASALVIHTLHVVAGSRAFDNLWLDQLPQRVPGPIENEVAKGYVFRSKTQFTLDDVRHYPFPWMLRATVEAYESGTTAQRARALLWLEEAFKNPLRQEDFRDRVLDHGRDAVRAAPGAGVDRPPGRRTYGGAEAVGVTPLGVRRSPGNHLKTPAACARPCAGISRASPHRLNPCRTGRARACVPWTRTAGGCHA